MSTLNDLIERLYHETITRQHAAAPHPPLAGPSSPPMPDEGVQLPRLRQALDQMGSLLRAEDELCLDVTPPTDAICIRILNHWEAMMQSIEGIQSHIQSLEADIQRMQPWGDFDVLKVEKLAQSGLQIRFWRMDTLRLAASNGAPWYADSQLLVVSREGSDTYFVTVTPTSTPVPMPPEAHEVTICPSPVSTLIMLQTRYKDSLRKKQSQLEDYALAHYAELYSTLRHALPEGSPLPQLRSSHHGLRERIRRLFG